MRNGVTRKIRTSCGVGLRENMTLFLRGTGRAVEVRRVDPIHGSLVRKALHVGGSAQVFGLHQFEPVVVHVEAVASLGGRHKGVNGLPVARSIASVSAGMVSTSA
jgi:hypothetical protein